MINLPKFLWRQEKATSKLLWRWLFYVSFGFIFSGYKSEQEHLKN